MPNIKDTKQKFVSQPRCPMCNTYTYTQEEDLMAHIQSCARETVKKMKQCKQCKYQTDKPANLARHMRAKHPETPALSSLPHTATNVGGSSQEDDLSKYPDPGSLTGEEDAQSNKGTDVDSDHQSLSSDDERLAPETPPLESNVEQDDRVKIPSSHLKYRHLIEPIIPVRKPTLPSLPYSGKATCSLQTATETSLRPLSFTIPSFSAVHAELTQKTEQGTQTELKSRKVVHRSLKCKQIGDSCEEEETTMVEEFWNL